MDEVTRQLCLEGGRKGHPRYGAPDSVENDEGSLVGPTPACVTVAMADTRQRLSRMASRAAAVGRLRLV